MSTKKYIKFNKKYIFSLLTIIVCIFVLFAMYKKYYKAGNRILPVQYSQNIGYWFNEKGAFKSEGILTYFYSAEHGKRYIACNRNGCNHDTKECPAYGSNTAITYDNTGIYYVSIGEGEGPFQATLYHVDIDGDNKEKIHDFKSMEIITDAVYIDNKLYIAYQNTLDKNGNTMDENEVGILEYDIRTKRERHIFNIKKNNAYISSINVNKGKLFILCAYSDMTYDEAVKYKNNKKFIDSKSKYLLLRVDLQNLREKVIAKKIFYLTNIPIVGNYIIYAKDNGTYAYNMDKENSKMISHKICEVLENISTNNEVIIFNTNESGKREYVCYNKYLKKKRKVESEKYCVGFSEKYVYLYDKNANLLYEKTNDFLAGKNEVRKFK